MDQLRQDLSFALRSLGRKPAFTLLAAAMLALGIGANTAIFSVVNAVALRPLPYEDPEALLYIGASRDGELRALSAPEFLRLRDESRALEGVAVAVETHLNFLGQNAPERISGARISANLLPVLGIEPILGRNFAPTEDLEGADAVVLMTYAAWQRRFGTDPNMLHRHLQLNGREHAVVGVLPPGFVFPTTGVELYVPAAFSEMELSNPGGHFLDGAVGRLAPGVSADAAVAEADGIMRRAVESFADHRAVHGATASPLQGFFLKDYHSALLVLVASVGFVLLIACANVANLLLVRAAERRREIAVRTALGAARARLVRQLLTESTLLALLGGAWGLLVALWAVDLVVRLSPRDVPRIESVAVDWAVFAFASAISLGAGLLFGVVPALEASRSRVERSLHETTRGEACGSRDSRSRNFLVSMEVALALVLLVGAGLSLRSFWILGKESPGFEPDHVLTARLVLPETKYPEGAAQADFGERLLEEVRALPGVRSASLIAPMPLTSVVFGLTIQIPDREPPADGRPLSSNWRAVMPGYFSTMGIHILAGRDIDESDMNLSGHEGRSVLVVNETFARNVFPGEDPLGKLVRIGYNDLLCEIVGVVGDVRHEDLATASGEEMYTPFWATPLPEMNLALAASSDPESLTASLREAVRRIDPEQPVFGIHAMRDLVRASVASRRFVMTLLLAFALTALLLAALGIYSVVSYSVVQRTREIGVRVALGASGPGILRLVLEQGLSMAGTGAILGIGSALLLSRFLESQLYGISATDFGTYSVVSGALVLVALGATAFPALRASRLDPIVALRYE